MRSLRSLVFSVFFIMPFFALGNERLSPSLILDEWNEKMGGYGYEWFNRPTISRLQAFDVDQIYYQFGSQKFAVFRYFEKNEKLLDTGVDFREIESSDGRWIIAFKDFDKREMDQLAKLFRQHLDESNSKRNSWKWNLLINEAHANNEATCFGRNEKN